MLGALMEVDHADTKIRHLMHMLSRLVSVQFSSPQSISGDGLGRRVRDRTIVKMVSRCKTD
jgi:hypothetical protein